MSGDKIDLNRWDRRCLSAKKDLEKSNLSEKNKKLIFDFVRFKKNAHRVEDARQTKYIQNLHVLANTLNKDFDKISKADIDALLETIYSWSYTDWTKRAYIQILKAFYKWMGRTDLVEWIKVPCLKCKKVRPDEIISWTDAVRLSECAMNARDRALPQVLHESGCRIGELLTLSFEDIEKVNQGEAIILHLRQSKTDVREVVIVDSAPALTEWLEAHPKKNGFIWVNLKENNGIMIDSAARQVLKNLAKRSGLSKKVNPHQFRKSAATILASNEGFSEAELKKRFGWIASSKMLDTYVHLSDKRVTKKYLQQKGILPPDEKAKKNEPVKCKWCNTINAVGKNTCRLCKRPLQLKDIEIRDNLEKRIDELSDLFFTEKINEFKEFMKNKGLAY